MRPTRLRTLVHGSNTYFITTATWQRRPIFRTDRLALPLLESIFNYRDQHKYLLHEFVIMPDHLHLLLTPTSISVERAAQFIKGGFSHRVGAISGNLEIWQVGFSDRRVRNMGEFNALRDYIHNNPVKARLCNTPGDHPYSSARIGYSLDLAPASLSEKELPVLRRG